MVSRFLLTALSLLSSSNLVSSLTVTQADFSALAASLVTANSGLTLLSGSFSGNAAQAGTYTNGPQSLADGVVLSTGDAKNAALPKTSDANSRYMGGGSPLCSAIAEGDFRDAAVLTLNLAIDKTKYNGVSLSFIFASEEFPAWVGSKYNDVLGIFVNDKNVALDSAGQRVAINNGFFSSANVVTNDDSAYGGSTQKLIANTPVAAGVSTVKLEIVVCDNADQDVDSAVFLTGLKGITCEGNCDGIAVLPSSTSSTLSTSSTSSTSSTTSTTSTTSTYPSSTSTTSTSIASSTSAPVPSVNPKCSHDNCLRGLLFKNGVFFTAAYEACKTALPTITVLRSGTATQTITGPANLPTNANVCDGQGIERRLPRYISACGCASVFPVTTTIIASATMAR
ncbi:hypothetical protein BCR37DRAFT_388732 [Protomyces lactucae-debilis]|uniref:Uncharacterized protein n=1 Tax=Protomyces lactucae-debilis TaxID=2754530 RepID=A0A1Y2F6H5_PROLT|nr:uncharacterized protein BCR37DRAFT_388732 [Protomyces lactucae-debilis]ORY78535.1 hypothetical protein BCR37DRAFT_388732 [Protomyces lactucae-debilis]